MNDIDGTSNLLHPEWRKLEYKNAVLWWNLGKLLYCAINASLIILPIFCPPSFVLHALSIAILFLAAGKL